MSPTLQWRNKLRRRFYKPYNKIFHGKRYFISRYFGADFLISSANLAGLEISAKIGEYPEIKSFMQACAVLRPHVFLDIGAHIGLYTCILMKNGLVPHAILFEPDRLNRAHLRANLLINNLLGANVELHKLALGAAPSRFRLVPGPQHNLGLSQIVEQTDTQDGYEVDIARLDDLIALSGKTLAIKIDIERYERKALAGMARTLRDNNGIVQIEVLEAREEITAMMADAGYTLARQFPPNLVFRKP
jgi:FkbM family methyltransferase